MYAQQVDEEWQTIKGGPDTISKAFVDQIAGRFVWPQYDPAARDEPDHSAELAAADKRYARWLRTNVHAHKVPGYAAVTVSLRPPACRPATSPPTRWTRSPRWPTSMASANCASRTSRT